jgi:hypothetical protein
MNFKVLDYRRRTRSTKTIVTLSFEGHDHPDGPWMTLCEDHGGCVHHQTKALALQWLSHPEEWCPTCKGEPE